MYAERDKADVEKHAAQPCSGLESGDVGVSDL